MKGEPIVRVRLMTNTLYEPENEEIRKLHITVLSRKYRSSLVRS